MSYHNTSISNGCTTNSKPFLLSLPRCRDAALAAAPDLCAAAVPCAAAGDSHATVTCPRLRLDRPSRLHFGRLSRRGWRWRLGGGGGRCATPEMEIGGGKGRCAVSEEMGSRRSCFICGCRPFRYAKWVGCLGHPLERDFYIVTIYFRFRSPFE